MAQWIVMTSSAKMPNSCWGKYRNVAIVQLNQEYTAKQIMPAMISARARGALQVRHLGHFRVGKTGRCAYHRAVDRAEELAYAANNAGDVATAALLTNPCCA